ncbi:hypothetical protein [Parapedobacter sp. 2B3]|uniref:hypothetical protein n=1 Tax=Parapedobacter sp. 2B3 TaxID=3342381 RepID=UPI0035B5F4F4
MGLRRVLFGAWTAGTLPVPAQIPSKPRPSSEQAYSTDKKAFGNIYADGVRTFQDNAGQFRTPADMGWVSRMLCPMFALPVAEIRGIRPAYGLIKK